MDESSGNHQLRHHQLQVVGGSSSSSSSSSFSSQPSSSAAPRSNNLYGGATGGDHGWTQNFTFDGGLVNPARNHHQDHLSFQWNTNSHRFTAATSAAVKDEEGSSLSSSTTTTSSDPFPRFTDMLITNDDSSASSSIVVSDNSSSSSFGYHHYSHGGHYQFLPFNPNSSGSSSSLIYPSINVSSLNQTDVNLQALDQNLLFAGTSLLRDHHQGIINPYPAADPMPQYCTPTTTKVSSTSEMRENSERVASTERDQVKRCNSGSIVKEQSSTTVQLQASTANKKSKVDQPRASCPPFKVRKEKLGDRITALQQLVAPFGKTDTASVLMEAIGYINFLQNQVETLSVPYMKSTRNKPPQSTHFQQAEGGTGEVSSRDLRSRGLCLVPLSCTSYITNIDTGAAGGYSGAMWPPPPPHFGQGTYNL